MHGRAHPAHIALVGPRGAGKTRIARGVALRHTAGSRTFAGAALIDLRSAPPESGDALIARVSDAFAGSLARSAAPELKELAEQLGADAPEMRYDLLKMAVDLLRGAGRRWLIVLDGCDAPLGDSGIPRNAWDNLRVLGEGGAVTYLTTSRAPLSELCSREVRLSPFFNLFDPTPVWVGPLDDADWARLAAEQRERLDTSAIEALRRWTGGNPYLLDTLVRVLDERAQREALSAGHVDIEAEGLLKDQCEAMRHLWRDCSLETQQDLVRLAGGPVSLTGWRRDRVLALTRRGLAREERGAVHGSSELMRRTALEYQPGVEDLRRNFGTPEGFDHSIQAVLELRLAQVQSADLELLKTVRFCVDQIARSPQACLGRARDVRDRALALVWEREAPGKRIPEDWLDCWRHSGVTREVETYGRNPRIPADGGQQCGLLRLAIGRAGLAPVVRSTSRTTHALIEHMNVLGNVRNHSGDSISVTLAAAFCLAAIELCESLSRDG